MAANDKKAAILEQIAEWMSAKFEKTMFPAK
jgi:hypothetical protein